VLPSWSVTEPAAGLTVIVKLIGSPTQLTPPLVKVGVTVIVPVMGVAEALIAVKDAIFPVPDEGKPKLVKSLVQE
jgi:hypothetical protein